MFDSDLVLCEPRHIKAQLKELGYTAISLSNELAVTRSAIYQSIDGAGSRFIRVKIAHKLNTNPRVLWPRNDKRTQAADEAFYNMPEDVLNEIRRANTA